MGFLKHLLGGMMGGHHGSSRYGGGKHGGYGYGGSPPGQSLGAPCPKCGAATLAGGRFCQQCGASLGLTCGSCAADIQPGAKFCPQCGKTA